ncbi:unnamed protein product [Nesidiocoris tenuis]|uniref:Uncharacterized protein n=1 Tax=Nesidiocoris tenuis TaxID=355587 RepID=A0A6H5GXH0_9HEMI|nr:unnamed protein product [Nesidiocoris tenuis]
MSTTKLANKPVARRVRKISRRKSSRHVWNSFKTFASSSRASVSNKWTIAILAASRKRKQGLRSRTDELMKPFRESAVGSNVSRIRTTQFKTITGPTEPH